MNGNCSNSASLNLSNSSRKQQTVFKIPGKTFSDSTSSTQQQQQNDCGVVCKGGVSSSIVSSATPRPDKTALLQCPASTPNQPTCSNQLNANSIKTSVRRLFSPNSAAKSTLNTPSLASSNQTITAKKQLQLSTPQSTKQITTFLLTQQISRASSQQAIHSLVSSTSIASTKVLIDPNPNTTVSKTSPNEINHSNNLREVGGSLITPVMSTSNDMFDDTSTASCSSSTNSTLSSSTSSQLKAEPKIIKKKPASSSSSTTSSSYSSTTNETLTQSTIKPCSQRNTPTSSLKKHLHILKSSSKKALIANNNNNNNTAASSNKTSKKTDTVILISPHNLSMSNSSSPANSVNSSPLAQQQSLLSMKLNEYETKIKALSDEIDSKGKNASSARIKELETEIERLSRLYDYEMSKQSKLEEKMYSLKQMAEEKQIESAAIKYEYRKVQEQKESLAAENQFLKSFFNSLNVNASGAGVGGGVGAIVLAGTSRHSSPSSNFNSPRLRNNSSLSIINNNAAGTPSTPISSPMSQNSLKPQDIEPKSWSSVRIVSQIKAKYLPNYET